MKYRKLTSIEIDILEKQGCVDANNWKDFNVSELFSPTFIKNSSFSGVNYIGSLGKEITLVHNIIANSSIINARINNCTIGNNVYIQNIGNIISSYTIEDDVQIINTNEIVCNTESTFGNGVKVATVNEARGREVTIYNKLSAQIAFLLCFYRHNQKLITTLEKSISDYCETIRSTNGTISKGAQIYNSGTIINVNIGESAHINGILSLENGTVNSTHEHPSRVENGTIMKNFITASGSSISDSAQVSNCFIGEACEIAGGFSAENSLFFANSQALLGEACSIFAGPYTVTHHKSTLLIAGNFSFFNAGSATNQSNHMYKLGPVHQGIMERGCKTGSGSYVLWPSKIGPFTMILGKHYSNADTSDLPFSYLIEDNGKSVLMPGQNMFTVGTARDIEKWPKRDKRNVSVPLDEINYSALNPFTINKVIKGIDILNTLLNKAKSDSKSLMYKGILITVGSIKRGITLYEQILTTYIGDTIIENTDDITFKGPELLEQHIEWLDISGMILKSSELNFWIKSITEDGIDCNDLNLFFKSQNVNYKQDLQEHALGIAYHYFNKNLSEKEQLVEFMDGYIETSKKNKSSIIMDAKKEFNIKTKTGFGIYGDSNVIDNDFDNVRGTVDSNDFVKSLEIKFSELELKVNTLIKSL